ncbi:MAG: phosphomannose isomerase type II C-terminal cupin domain [Alphaproteobacteria bacterium]|nr:phosphomannose isomerase type II C-terminal cupin domain [Alphaproteobacteria bacterium]MBO4644474.1 phosphomannose isomerase type II C-terminal cupin domain [Alphaproteobacteria bacterium]
MVVKYEKGASDTRPWGTWEILDTGEYHTVKRIVVRPGQKLSLQSHNHRDEHWIITQGTAEVTNGDKIVRAEANTPVFIPAKTKHRIENIGKTDVIFIEVQTGDLLDENDIIRYEDIYGRV